MKRRTIRRIRFWAPVISAVGLVIVIGQEYVRPWVVEKLYAGEYKRLAFACDMAMHEEAALRQQSGDIAKSEALHLSADVGMMICHDYDKLRKQLLMYGMSEDQLAMLGLEVLEVEQITVRQMVDAHRMDRF